MLVDEDEEDSDLDLDFTVDMSADNMSMVSSGSGVLRRLASVRWLRKVSSSGSEMSATSVFGSRARRSTLSMHKSNTSIQRCVEVFLLPLPMLLGFLDIPLLGPSRRFH